MPCSPRVWLHGFSPNAEMYIKLPAQKKKQKHFKKQNDLCVGVFQCFCQRDGGIEEQERER